MTGRPSVQLPREGELTWYDRAGWANPCTYRVTSRWLVLTTEDGDQMAFERADLAAVLDPRGAGGCHACSDTPGGGGDARDRRSDA